MKTITILSLTTILVSSPLFADSCKEPQKGVHYGDKVTFNLRDAYYIGWDGQHAASISETGEDFYHEKTSECTGTIARQFGASQGDKKLYEIEHLHCSYPGPNYTVYLFK